MGVITIDTNINAENPALIFFLLALSNGYDNNTIPYLLNNSYIGRVYKDNIATNEFYVMDKGINYIEDIITRSSSNLPNSKKIEELANKLRELYPEGKKEGTNLYWRGSIKEITLKLQGFYKRFGNSYTEEQILKACKDFVASYNGDYRYMPVLKYFIWKSKGSDELVSELASYIENEGTHHNTQWMVNLT